MYDTPHKMVPEVVNVFIKVLTYFEMSKRDSNPVPLLNRQLLNQSAIWKYKISLLGIKSGVVNIIVWFSAIWNYIKSPKIVFNKKWKDAKSFKFTASKPWAYHSASAGSLALVYQIVYLQILIYIVKPF